MAWGAVITAGGAILGGVISSKGTKSAANTAAAGSDAAAAEQAREFNLIRSDTAPYRAIGEQALNSLGSIYGYAPSSRYYPAGSDTSASAGSSPMSFNDFVASQGGLESFSTNPLARVILANNAYQTYQANPSGSANGFAYMPDGSVQPRLAVSPSTGAPLGSPDYSNFFASPDYQFRKQQGMQGIENTFSATGGAKSGNALRALADYNSSLAAGEFGNYFNRQAALAGIGQTATNSTTAAGLTTAANVGNSLQNSANARASGIAGQYDAYGNALNGLGSAIGYWYGNRKQPVNNYYGGGFGPTSVYGG